jgi:hypothetical protein
MNRHRSGMGVVTDGAVGIDPHVAGAYAPAGFVSCHQVPKRDAGNLRVRVPWQEFSGVRLPGHDNRAVPAGWLPGFHGSHVISNFVELLWIGQDYISCHFRII